MNNEEKCLLIKQATRLATLGVTVECEREQLRKLVDSGIPYTAPKMLVALERFERSNAVWERLEAEHLALKKKFDDKIHK